MWNPFEKKPKPVDLEALEKKRSKLTLQLDSVQSDLKQLTDDEELLCEEGKKASSKQKRMKWVRLISQARKTITLLATKERALTKQCNIIDGYTHNISLAETADAMKSPEWPTDEALTEGAVNAEEAIEQIDECESLVSGSEVSIDLSLSKEEAEILAEMESGPESKEEKVDPEAQMDERVEGFIPGHEPIPYDAPLA